MSSLIMLSVIVVIVTMLSYFAVNEENRLKSASVVFVSMLLVTFGTISEELGEITTELVQDDGDPHYGLPSSWNGTQVVCFHFPSESSPEDFDQGRYHIDTSGITIFVDDNWENGNVTGACVGGFEGYEEGLDLLNAAVNVTGDSFSLNVTEFSFGLQINSIGGVSPCEVYTCADDFSSGAYWELLNDGAYSMVGISDLTLNDDTVITWQIASY
tara:strand:+ start:2416 stop:3057 length:642 start_codon:yes stop_codon:yes gene_type:complete